MACDPFRQLSQYVSGEDPPWFSSGAISRGLTWSVDCKPAGAENWIWIVRETTEEHARKAFADLEGRAMGNAHILSGKYDLRRQDIRLWNMYDVVLHVHWNATAGPHAFFVE